MKKFLSMFLVLTMVVTTLMGVMVIDVNALSQSASEDANSTAGLKITIGYGKPSFPAKISASNGIIREGSWYAYGYTYTDSLTTTKVSSKYRLTDDTQVVKGTKTDEVHFLDAEVVSNPLAGDMMKYDFKKTTIVDESYKAQGNINDYIYDSTGTTQVSYNKPNYLRIAGLTPLKADAFAGWSFGSLSKANITATNTNSTAYKITFYAYTQDVGSGSVGSEFTIESRNPNLSVKVADDYVVSKRGVPHKVDLVWSSDGTNTIYHMYIDGVEMGEGKSGAISTSDITLQPRFEASMAGVNQITVNSTDWYITQPATKITFGDALSQTEVSNSLIVVPNYTKAKQATEFRTDDYITGVIASLDADIKAVLETTTAGDKIVDITESKYNNPASLFDTTVENPTVKLVSRTTGEEVAPASATGTMDDYYFMVNGIYIIPNKVADPLPYYKTSTDPFDVSASNHQATVTRIHYENYEDNVMDEDLPALGGLRSGFLKYTNAPRGTFSFYNGNIKYGTNDGYYAIKTPQIKLADHGDLDKKLTFEFDMYVPEYVAGRDTVRITLNGHADPSVTGTNSSTLGKDIDAICFTTNGLTESGFSAKRVADLEGNAWNTVAITFDSTDTATDGKYDISVYVNGELQVEYETGALFKANAAGTETAGGRLCSLNICRLYMPLYTSVGIMNDAWYAGNYTIEKTAVAEGTLDSTNVSDVEISVDNNNNLVAYDNTNDTDYSALISAMTAAGYQPVYNQVVDVDLINEKYDEVDGLIDSKVNEDGTRTVTGKLVKKWMDSSSTNADVVAATDENNFSTYTIKDANITAAVDNGDGTASITIKSGFGNTGSYKGIASTYEDIIAALAAENPPRIGRTLELTGFAVVEDGKLPKIYSLQEMGTDLYTLAYDETTKVATLNYREFGGTDNIPFVLVVGAYDANGKLLALDVSDAMAIDSVNEADGVKTKTFTANFGELDLTTVRKYKVFAFNSFAERKPIITNYSMINPAYVAPAE